MIRVCIFYNNIEEDMDEYVDICVITKDKNGGDVRLSQHSSGDIYVIKRIGSDRYKKQDRREESIRVHQLVQKICNRCDYIVKILDVIRSKGKICIVMEHCREETLYNYIVRSHVPLSVTTLIQTFSGLAEGVQLLHNNFIVHHDIKPENIFYKNGHPKLFDFDLSSGYHGTVGRGTAIYYPPELAEPFNTKSGFSQFYDYNTFSKDIYALGCVFRCLFLNRIDKECILNPARSNKRMIEYLPESVVREELMTFEYYKDYPQIPKLIVRMMDYDYNHRPSISEVVKEINQIKESILESSSDERWEYIDRN